MTGKNNSELSKDWYKFAMMDLDSAKYLCGMRPKPLEIICYHCQQSAEKMLKGYLVENAVEPPKTHDLIELRKMCEKINTDFEELKEASRFLTAFGVQPRYPNEIQILESDTEKALESVENMTNFYKSQGIEVKDEPLSMDDYKKAIALEREKSGTGSNEPQKSISKHDKEER